MLFAWLFSIASGWVNACVLEARPSGHGHALPHDTLVATPAASAAPHDDVQAGLEACLSFCASEHGVVPTLKLPALADLDADLQMAAGAWPPVAAGRISARGLPRAAPPPPGPPVAIRFLRLTI